MNLPLTPQVVLAAYRLGAFPMADETGEVLWFSPDPRCIIPLDAFHVTRSLRQVVRRRTYEVRVDTAFDEVIAACSDRREGTWISPRIMRVYRNLHREGHAHSVETWLGGELAGGLYGLALGGAFFGESMFHRAANASKVALVALVDRLRERGFTLLDTQWPTPHLERFGAVEIARDEYLHRLSDAVALPARFVDSPDP